MPNETPKAGLEDVVAGMSEICFIDGLEGRLLYRGYDIHDLAEHASFEEVVYLLWYGSLPTRAELERLEAELASHTLPGDVMEYLRRAPKNANPMSVLRTAVSMLSDSDERADDNSREANLAKAARMTALIPAIVAAYARLRQGKEPVAPDPELGLARNFLYMLDGQRPGEPLGRIFDVCLVLHADHELNASTFAARETVSTLSDLYSAITSAIGTLKGPAHGGANTAVMKMLLEIGEPERVDAWVHEALDSKKKIMGFGHRVYRTEDPRATHLREFARQLCEQSGNTKYFLMQRRIEEIMLQEKGLYPNVDFYSATTYYSMGIPVDLFTPIFAISRISGWTAHALEQYANNRLIRPRAEYVGPTRETYVPIAQR
ncbi:MAG: citrate synthase [Bacillota bacterium]|nr:citrate synthase [Bacillota bacterium]